MMSAEASLPTGSGTIGAPPSKPALEDFALSQSDLDRLPRTAFSFWIAEWPYTNTRQYNRFAVYFCCDAIAFLAIWYHPGMQISFDNILGFVAFSFVSFIPMLAFIATAGYFEKRLLCAFSPRFLLYCAFLDAQSEYQKAKLAHDQAVAARELEISKQFETYWRSLTGQQFERELSRLFAAQGYAVNLTPHTSDGGVDIKLVKDGKTIVVQCKAHAKRIPISVARELCASIDDFEAEAGIIACLAGVTKPTAEYIRERNITVLDVHQIVALQRRYSQSS